jgi:hypothetical protein
MLRTLAAAPRGGHGSARRRRNRNNRAARIAVPVAAVMALGLTVGILIGVSGNHNPKLHSAASSGSTGVSATSVQDTCDIIVPANPLTAKGLATPYQLTGAAGGSPANTGCQMINSINLGAFVQATILNPKTGALYVYNPLVITAGTTPAVAPVVPKLPKHAIVTIDFGFNGAFLIQKGATPDALAQGNCTGGMPGSPFGQVSFCNGPNFFNAAFGLERAGRMHVPFAGMSRAMVATEGSLGTGRECPTVRNFDMIDQDPSDNVTAKYLLDPATGQTAQDTTANAARMPGAKVLVNGSDNALIDNFLDPALGCTPMMAPDLGNRGMMSTSQALDELLAARNQPAEAALIPENDAMVMERGEWDVAKTDLYRAELGQAPVDSQTNATSSPQMFCQNMINIQTSFIAANQSTFATQPSPVPTMGDSLYTFLGARLASSFDNLNCANFGLHQPVQMVIDGAGAATQITLNTATQTASF